MPIESVYIDRFVEVCKDLMARESIGSTEELAAMINEPPHNLLEIFAHRKRLEDDLVIRLGDRFRDVNKAYITAKSHPKFHSDLVSETDKRLARIESSVQEVLEMLHKLVDKK